MGNFDVTTPAGSDLLSQGDDIIREAKLAIREALRAGMSEGSESIFPGSSPSTAPVYRYRGLKGTTAQRPPSGQYGLYFDTTRNVLQRDSGSIWDDIATIIPSGTRMVFYQASAPVGWTAVPINDKFLRVVTAGGTGGSTGGTVAASTSLAHTHTVASHTHTMATHTHTTPNHAHQLYYTTRAGNNQDLLLDVGTSNSDSQQLFTIQTPGGAGNNSTRRLMHGYTQTSGGSTTESGGASDTGQATPETNSQLGVFAYADVIVGSKD